MSLLKPVWFCALLLSVSLRVFGAEEGRVQVLRLPEGGIQPQAAVDEAGVAHVIYYKGKAGGGDLFYVRHEPGAAGFSKPIQVNSRPGSAMSVGSIRGAHLALGRNGRAHVAWMGGEGASRARTDVGETTPMVYTRLKSDGSGFEPERNVLTYAAGLDGGGSVAADREGNVYVVWHAPKPGNKEGEAGRMVFIAQSKDDGKTFAPERPALAEPTGACGCCGMRAFADRNGALYILYRGASEMVNREEILMVSRNQGETFQILNRDNWKTPACPMSSAALSEGQGRTLAAWETDGRVWFGEVGQASLKLSPPVTPPGSAKRKHPFAAGNGKGETLLAWTEGTGWERGGSLHWQLFDATGKPMAEKGAREGVPVWGLVSAFAEPNGGFWIVY